MQSNARLRNTKTPPHALPRDSRMTAIFETSRLMIRRIETGSQFRLNLVPLEFASYNASYENPVHGLSIGLLVIFLTETFELNETASGRVLQQPVNTGIVLEQGKLQRTLEERLTPDAVEVVVKDAYELMIALLANQFSGRYNLNEEGIKFGIYEAEKRRFNDVVFEQNWKTPAAKMIAALQAKLVF